MDRLRDSHTLTAAALFVAALGVYVLTTSSTISFWDCGEFVATAHGLGIPHQPGTPLYVLVGRVFSLLPLGLTVAHKINLMSGFFASLAVVFMYLTGVRLQRNWAEEKADSSPPWLVQAGAAAGALFLALSHTFWGNAIEAEVYSLAAFVLALCGYLAVRWYELRERESSANVMLLIVYLMGLSIGFHLGSVLIYPGIFVLVLLSRNRALSAIDLWIVSLAMGTFVLSTMLKWDGFIMFLAALSLGLALWRLLRPSGNGFALAGILLFLLGLSVHLFMLIRTTQDPFINQSVPDTLERLMTVLRREQYPPRSPLTREAPLLWQFQHLWGSAVWQSGPPFGGRTAVGYLQQFTFLPRPGFLDTFMVTGLWLYGLVTMFRGERRLFWAFFTTLFINSIGLLTILNFTSGEVRDRDYFYFGAFQFVALFLGLGIGGLLRAVWLSSKEWSGGKTLAKLGAAFFIVLACLPVLVPDHPKLFAHDRSDEVVARNYGYNMLIGLPKDAILFTNGDNDTFPLWYIQDVEGVRPDVRVVNLSLINLAWYIKQLRDLEPSLPISWTDRQVEGREFVRYRNVQTKLQAQYTSDGSIIYVRDMALDHVIRVNQWKRPIYFAVTIPNEYIQDFLPYCTMEGLVYRLGPQRSETGDPMVDSDKIMENLSSVYDMSGVVRIETPRIDQMGSDEQTGLWVQGDSTNYRLPVWQQDTSVYRDPNATHLLRNYPASLARVAFFEALDGREQNSLRALELAFSMDPTFGAIADLYPLVYFQMGEPEMAVAVADTMLDVLPDPTQVAIDTGERLLTVGALELALEWAEKVRQRWPDDPAFVRLKFRTHWTRGEYEAAERELADWVTESGDREAMEELGRVREYMREEAMQRAIEADSTGTGGGGVAPGGTP